MTFIDIWTHEEIFGRSIDLSEAYFSQKEKEIPMKMKITYKQAFILCDKIWEYPNNTIYINAKDEFPYLFIPFKLVKIISLLWIGKCKSLLHWVCCPLRYQPYFYCNAYYEETH